MIEVRPVIHHMAVQKISSAICALNIDVPSHKANIIHDECKLWFVENLIPALGIATDDKKGLQNLALPQQSLPLTECCLVGESVGGLYPCMS